MIDFLIGAKYITLFLYGVWGMIFTKNLKLKKIVLCYYCSIDLKRQSEASGLRLDTCNLVLFNIQTWLKYAAEFCPD